MTLEEWVWCLAVARGIGYPVRSEEYGPPVDNSAIATLRGHKEADRIFDVVCERPGFLRVRPRRWQGPGDGSSRYSHEFDLADPDSIDKAVAFARRTFRKPQRERWDRWQQEREAVLRTRASSGGQPEGSSSAPLAGVPEGLPSCAPPCSVRGPNPHAQGGGTGNPAPPHKTARPRNPETGDQTGCADCAGRKKEKESRGEKTVPEVGGGKAGGSAPHARTEEESLPLHLPGRRHASVRPDREHAALQTEREGSIPLHGPLGPAHA